MRLSEPGRTGFDPLAFDRLRAMVEGDEDVLSRLSAALWARVGRPISPDGVGWARDLWRDEGAPDALWRALKNAGVVSGEPPVLRASPLASLLAALAGEGSRGMETDGAHLVWTLPSAHPSRDHLGGSYFDAVISLVEEARERLVLVSPYVEARGIGLLFDSLSGALARGVAATLVTHDLSNIASANSRAVEELRREAERVGGRLEVFSAESPAGRDRERHPLLHAKLVVVDRSAVLLGSANLTSYGLSSNFEAGTLLSGEAAREADDATRALVDAGLVRRVFRTGSEHRR